MTLWEVIFEWLTRASGVTVIRRDQGGTLPPRPFVTAKAIAESREGQSYVGKLDAQGIVKIQQGSLVTIAIQVFGPGAMAIAGDIRNSVEKITIQEFLRGKGACYVRVMSGPTDIAAVVGTSFEERASIDIQLRANVVILDDVGFIERIELTGIIPPIEEKRIVGVTTP